MHYAINMANIDSNVNVNKHINDVVEYVSLGCTSIDTSHVTSPSEQCRMQKLVNIYPFTQFNSNNHNSSMVQNIVNIRPYTQLNSIIQNSNVNNTNTGISLHPVPNIHPSSQGNSIIHNSCINNCPGISVNPAPNECETDACGQINFNSNSLHFLCWNIRGINDKLLDQWNQNLLFSNDIVIITDKLVYCIYFSPSDSSYLHTSIVTTNYFNTLQQQLAQHQGLGDICICGDLNARTVQLQDIEPNILGHDRGLKDLIV